MLLHCGFMGPARIDVVFVIDFRKCCRSFQNNGFITYTGGWNIVLRVCFSFSTTLEGVLDP